jgi:general secretion pathway protein G
MSIDGRLRSAGWSAGRGFTFIDLVIALAIMATVATISVPFYTQYVGEVRIASVIRDLTNMALILDDRFADGDPPATLAEVGLDLIDPWGNPYEYLWLRGNPAPGINGKRRKDKALNPVNTDYDLYSVGPDGRTQAQFVAKFARDDIVRANDGAFFGVAADH